MVRHSRLTALGILLCLLSALFFVEAKIAWFSPAGSATAQISADKARPAEPPKALPHRFTSPAPAAHDFAGASAFVAFSLLRLTAATPVSGVIPAAPLALPSLGISPPHFFRPPPAL